MSDYDINKMDFKQLRNEVQLLRDELAIMKRKYEDILYNIDTDNFSQRIVKQGKDMYTKIEQTAEEITLQAEKVEENSSNIGKLTVSAEEIKSSVESVEKGVVNLSSSITQTKNSISLIIEGEYTEDILNNYLTGIDIRPYEIKVIINGETGNYSTFNASGLRFYTGNQLEGWALEPDDIGGELNYYVNGGLCYTFGHGQIGTGYSNTDMVIKAQNGQRDRFVVDVSKSGNKEVKFVGLNNTYRGSSSPCIYANEMELATCKWVEDYVSQNGGGGGTVMAVFA